MASSVSSESAFSAAGITISKWHNRLEGDIVEALQCLKSFLHQDLIFWHTISTHDEEEHLDQAEQDPANQEATASEVVEHMSDWTWDQLIEVGADDSDSSAA